MITNEGLKEFLEKAWKENKENLETYFKENQQYKYATDIKILKALIKYVINPLMKKGTEEIYNYPYGLDTEKITIVDGRYEYSQEGVLIFIIPYYFDSEHGTDVNFPSLYKYLWTWCYKNDINDTLLEKIVRRNVKISFEDETVRGTVLDLPNENQIQAYMCYAHKLLKNFQRLCEMR